METKRRIEVALNYIEDVMDEKDEKVLSIIREVLEDSTSPFHSIKGEAKPPFIYPFLDCEKQGFKWKRRIRLLADKMSNFNVKKNP